MNSLVQSDIVVSEYLTTFDLAIMGFFVAAYLMVPKLLRKDLTRRGAKEYLLMGQSLSLPLFVATLVATWYGGIFGVTQIAFENGVYSFFTQGLFWYVAYFIFAIFFAKKIRQKLVLSLPEMIGQKFGDKARKYSAIILFFHALPVTYAISTGLFLELALAIDFHTAIIIGVLIVAIYTSLGGFRGVVVTDCLQFILMFAAVLMVTCVLMYRFGTIDFLTEQLPPNYFNWRGESHVSHAIIWLFVACTSTLIHPVFYQRCLAAKTDAIAIKGVFIAMIFWLVFDTCTTLGGMYARALLPNANSAHAYVLLGLQILPPGLRGVFISGILATILSTLDSFMFVSGTSLSYDLFGTTNVRSMHAHKIAILLCSLFVIGVALVFGTDFEAAWLFREGSFSTALLVPVLATVVTRRTFSDGVFITTATCALITFALCSYGYDSNLITIEPFYAAHGAACVAFLISSYFHAQGKTKLARLPND